VCHFPPTGKATLETDFANFYALQLKYKKCSADVQNACILFLMFDKKTRRAAKLGCQFLLDTGYGAGKG